MPKNKKPKTKSSRPSAAKALVVSGKPKVKVEDKIKEIVKDVMNPKHQAVDPALMKAAKRVNE